jgi:hypothetical protein
MYLDMWLGMENTLSHNLKVWDLAGPVQPRRSLSVDSESPCPRDSVPRAQRYERTPLIQQLIQQQSTTINIMPDPSRASKRRRTGPPQIGAPSEADNAITPVNLPSSSAFSTRTVRSNHVLPLTSICARLFVASFPTFSRDPRQWEPRKAWRRIDAQLKRLPDATIQSLFSMLSSSCPHLLSHDLVKEVRIVGRVNMRECYILSHYKVFSAWPFYHFDKWCGRRTLTYQ